MVILALVVSTGTHWGVLQTVAWTAMLVDNLRTYSIAEAATRTFDGQHPCCLCKAIAAGKRTEQKAQYPLPVSKFEFPPMPDQLVLMAPAQFAWLPGAGDSFAETVSFPPPMPPPRSVSV